MKESINPEEIRDLDSVWHKLVKGMQKTSEELWKDKLEGASTIEISILSIVDKKPDVILKEIIEILGVPASTLTSAIDRLEKRGLLKRTISQRDRRSFGLELTADGQLAQKEHKRSEEILWERVLGAYDTAKERKELIRLLQILSDNIENSVKDGGDNAK